MYCKYCKEDKDAKEFKVTRIINGITYFRKKCQACKNIEQNGRRIKNRVLIQEFKRALKCEKCGVDDFRVLDFHHVDPKKKDTEISNMTHCSLERVKEEIAKCKCLCANCHRILHSEQILQLRVSQPGRRYPSDG